MIRNNGTQRLQPTLPLPDDTSLILLTDMGNARRFAVQHQNAIRYVQAWGWVAWDGRRWQQDDTGSAMRMARETVHQLFHEAQELNRNASELMAQAERAAQTQNRIAVELAQRDVANAQRNAKQMMDWAILPFKNNLHWSDLPRRQALLCVDMDALRAGLMLLADNSQPIASRFDEALGKVHGLGKGSATAILLIMFPDK